MDEATFLEVRSAPLFSELTGAQLACVEAGEVFDAPPGTVLVTQGARSPYFFVILSGELRLSRTYDRQEVLMGVLKPGMFTGEVTLLLDIPWLATARVIKPARLFQIRREDFWRMLGACHSVAQEIFQSAARKMRNMEGYSQQREKLASLGTMAAGLAHELNNPASAASRAAAQLRETTDKAQSLLCQLSDILNRDQWRALAFAAQHASEQSATAPALGHLDRSDRVEGMTEWLESRGVGKAWELAPTFLAAGVDIAWLEVLLAKLPPESHSGALGWLEARLDLRALLTDVEQSSGRVAALVKAMKSYSYMGQSPMQEVDIHDGLESTLTMLGHQLKNVTLVRQYDRSVPRITAFGSELNQVWTNLIVNAIDAVEGRGKICVGTRDDDGQLVVEIADDGPGIPPDVQAHLFEPFYTTKPVGAGTGLGLVISNRIIADRHGGEIEFESRPGETRFTVRLPVKRQP